MRFVDEAEILVSGGHGGPGSVHFFRDKNRRTGPPDGGDGGGGGSVRIEASTSLVSLGVFRSKRVFRARAGEPGRGENRTGPAGADVTIRVPVGTVVTDAETGAALGDLDRPGASLTAVSGGRGGLGNRRFVSSRNRSPEHAQPGEPGGERRLRLSLKLLADAGLVGLPNAGKSTLLAALTAGRPKIADYAFTTLSPNLGVVESAGEDRRLLLADIPGVIEGASRGAGLGLSFLRHIERVRVVVFVLDVSSRDIGGDFRMLRGELEAYSPALLGRPFIVVLNKLDLADYDGEFVADAAGKLEEAGAGRPRIHAVSARAGRGLAAFQEELFGLFSGPTFAESGLAS